MIAAWMAFTIVIGAFFAVAAFAVERLLAHSGRPTRFAWLGAIVASTAWPLILFASGSGATATPAEIDSVATAVKQATQIFAHATTTRLFVSFDTLLASVWIALTLFCAGRLAWGIGVIAAGRRDWAPRTMDGVPVLASNTIGPAVVGLRPMHIVLPQWVFDLHPHERTLVLQHEAEHVRARDPYLLWISAIAVTLMPWNPAMWLLARRLRIAVELDCDTRVLRAHRDAQRYGSLLLALAQRTARTPTLLSPALWEPRTSLERRITAMTVTQRTSRVRLATLLVFGASSIAVACSVGAPATQGPPPTGAARGATVTFPSAADSGPGAHYEFQVDSVATQLPGVGVPVYPAALKERGVGGKVLAAFVVDTTGRVDVTTFKVIASTDPQFTTAVRDALPAMRFRPALVNRRPVRQLVQMPYEFSVK